jgi:hypothetical protein
MEFSLERGTEQLRRAPATERPFDPVDREAGFDRFSGRTTRELLDRFAEVRATNLETLGPWRRFLAIVDLP